MGLIPEINRAWITVDNKLFLWDYLNPSDYLQYDGLTEVIISVTLTTPRHGIFTDIVKYLLVIATPVEIILLAITWNSDAKQIRLQHTKYAIPSDEVTMIKIVSTQNGRIFMGGNDGNLYELIYENHQDSWSTYLGIGETYKCRKVNHSSWNLVNIIPPLVKGIIGWDDTLCDLVIDDIRCLLYSITQKGSISVFYLGDHTSTQSSSSSFGDQSSHSSFHRNQRTLTPLLQSFNLFQQIRFYFENVSNNVALDSQYYDPVNNQITIIGAHVISQLESKALHLLVVLSSGIRVYLSATDDMGFITTKISQPPTV
jgi:nuclear pore complex protein Nup155